MLLLFTLILSLCPFTTTTLGFQEQPVPVVQHENAPSVDQILDHIKLLISAVGHGHINDVRSVKSDKRNQREIDNPVTDLN